MNPPPPEPSRREIAAWALYDFGNSAFATTILAVVFAVYLQKSLGAPEESWGYAVSGSMLLAAAIAPLLGAVCDFTAAKKRALRFFWLVGVAASAALALKVSWPVALVLFVVANLGFEASTAIYNAFLPEITKDATASRISSIGWACGYVGGGLHLFLALLVIGNPGWLGLEDKAASTRIALGSVGVWWFVFSLPMMFWLRERATPRPVPAGQTVLGAGARKILATLRNIRRLPTLTRYVIAFLFFNDGIQTVIVMAAPFGSKVLGMSEEDLIKCFLLIQGVAVAGALGLAWLARRLGDQRTLVLSLFAWCGILAYAFVMKEPREFWILGVLVGLVMGGSQAIARSLQARFTPPSSAAEFFGFFSITGKFASALGPFIYATVLKFTDNHRWAILSIAILFIVGLVLLAGVRERRGVEEMELEEKRLAAAR